ncbi:2OG-Fe(II) oxygenase [Novosphingobium sp.]|uniref:2OG-Fe(II) oxygenase n=1 Tax=Novosphingobium sp. TaxID=1874826 RepID=UPI0035ADAF75
MAGLIPRTQIFENFLADELRAELLDYTLASENDYVASGVHIGGEERTRDHYRIAAYHKDGLGRLKKKFRIVAEDSFERLCEGAGLRPFKIDWIEIEVAAHGDGAYFLPHIDTYTGRGRGDQKSDRLLTAVYYYHREPKGFSGGNLEIFPFGGGDVCQSIEPAQNRLACFSSTVLHQVSRVSCPSGKFADNRFALNIWYHRAK